jgi:hypothetical protein
MQRVAHTRYQCRSQSHRCRGQHAHAINAGEVVERAAFTVDPVCQQRQRGYQRPATRRVTHVLSVIIVTMNSDAPRVVVRRHCGCWNGGQLHSIRTGSWAARKRYQHTRYQRSSTDAAGGTHTLSMQVAVPPMQGPARTRYQRSGADAAGSTHTLSTQLRRCSVRHAHAINAGEVVGRAAFTVDPVSTYTLSTQ